MKSLPGPWTTYNRLALLVSAARSTRLARVFSRDGVKLARTRQGVFLFLAFIHGKELHKPFCFLFITTCVRAAAITRWQLLLADANYAGTIEVARVEGCG